MIFCWIIPLEFAVECVGYNGKFETKIQLSFVDYIYNGI